MSQSQVSETWNSPSRFKSMLQKFIFKDHRDGVYSKLQSFCWVCYFIFKKIFEAHSDNFIHRTNERFTIKLFSFENTTFSISSSWTTNTHLKILQSVFQWTKLYLINYGVIRLGIPFTVIWFAVWNKKKIFVTIHLSFNRLEK